MTIIYLLPKKYKRNAKEDRDSSSSLRQLPLSAGREKPRFPGQPGSRRAFVTLARRGGELNLKFLQLLRTCLFFLGTLYHTRFGLFPLSFLSSSSSSFFLSISLELKAGQKNYSSSSLDVNRPAQLKGAD